MITARYVWHVMKTVGRATRSAISTVLSAADLTATVRMSASTATDPPLPTVSDVGISRSSRNENRQKQTYHRIIL